ncbi:Phosphoribosyl transferase domain [Trypanosoma vivax]|uniref:Hypoxanthine phosphoribosyltransferase n=1 Tax=Trypanosoma vivax (strain Y486) TaxID=1055687 RepID=G0U5D7_TRYVY|nr:putative hypoxanthine-guanine phosphoribosyltransferase [Trypanosoma vivax]KAH8618362.1 Phosphoribosyl transferase domain [Trypanosoma vivax]CCC51085.1 putative hypoxanthine-guanine phosphoribosyltransferase [Trypanosoma vivax Y486]
MGTKSTRQYDFATRVVLTEEEVRTRTRNVAKRIAEDYRGYGLKRLENPLILVCVLKGSVVFAVELCRFLGDFGIPSRLEFICASSYGQGTVTSGEVEVKFDSARDVEGKHVLLVEDIVDTALTLKKLHDIFKERRPASLRTVVLMNKPDGRRVDFEPEYIVANVPNDFVVGYGLDYDESFREVRDVCALKPCVYEEWGKVIAQRQKNNQKSHL